MMLIYGHVNNYSRKRGMFIPYFGYKIGPYQAEGYLLNFPKLPYPEQYYNAIFLKLWAYNANDSVKYIQWHYDLYPDKKDFLLFLQRELRYRIETLDRIKNYKRQSISRICLEWVTKELNAVYDVQKIGVYNQFIKNELTVILKNELQNPLLIDYKKISMLLSRRPATKWSTWQHVMRLVKLNLPIMITVRSLSLYFYV